MTMAASRFLRFALVGCVGFAVDAGVTLAITEQAAIPVAFARIPAFILAATVTYLLNRRWTFATNTKPSAGGYLAYMLAMSAGLMVNYVVFVAIAAFTDSHSGILLAIAAGSIAGLAFNYMSARNLLGGDRDHTRHIPAIDQR